MWSKFLQRVITVIPWLFLGWLVGRGISGEMDGLLVFVLVIILIPLAITFNILTIVLFQGKAVLKRIRQAQTAQKQQSAPLKSKNYADLPWWHPKRWF